MEILSRVHRKNLVSWARDRENVLVLSADLTGSCEADLFRDTYPSRFISCGIAEQNMMSVAGGLAREGFIPLIHTFAVFIYRRAYDQIAMSVAYPNLPVKMFGFLPGIVTPGGATHQAIEDVSVMRALPNMTILETGDATDVESVLDVMRNVNGPVYIRMLRGELPRLFSADEPMKFDTPRIVSKGTDVTIISSGICTEETLRACAAMKKKGVSVNHVHVSTLKPFNNKMYADIINTGKYGVITVENHTTTGGLGTIVAEKAVACGINKRMARLGLRDTFTHGASRPYLMKEHGFDAAAIIHAVEKLTGNKLNISDDELAKVRIEAVHSEAKAEGL